MPRLSGRQTIRHGLLRRSAPRNDVTPLPRTLRVTIDTDRIDALAADRAALWDRVSNAAFLTPNEKREAVGYGRIAGGDRWG
jgi:phage portal protein BeeE